MQHTIKTHKPGASLLIDLGPGAIGYDNSRWLTRSLARRRECHEYILQLSVTLTSHAYALGIGHPLSTSKSLKLASHDQVHLGQLILAELELLAVAKPFRCQIETDPGDQHHNNGGNAKGVEQQAFLAESRAHENYHLVVRIHAPEGEYDCQKERERDDD